MFEHSAEQAVSTRLARVGRALAVFSGFCYTQCVDTYQIANGLPFADRTPKIPLGAIARATCGNDRRPPIDPLAAVGLADGE